jgi:hypothetical protein
MSMFAFSLETVEGDGARPRPLAFRRLDLRRCSSFSKRERTTARAPGHIFGEDDPPSARANLAAHATRRRTQNGCSHRTADHKPELRGLTADEKGKRPAGFGVSLAPFEKNPSLRYTPKPNRGDTRRAQHEVSMLVE